MISDGEYYVIITQFDARKIIILIKISEGIDFYILKVYIFTDCNYHSLHNNSKHTCKMSNYNTPS